MNPADIDASPNILRDVIQQSCHAHGLNADNLPPGNISMIFESAQAGEYHYRLRVNHPDATTPYDLEVTIREVTP